jgi:tetratricopeptide (TPR) repeat protein
VSQTDFVTRGQALVSAGQYQEAVKVCRLGLLGRPTAVEGRIVLGQALLALKRHDEVLAEMRVALELEPGSLAAQLLRGEALLRKGDGQAALEVLGKLRDRADAGPELAALLGEAERLVGRTSPLPIGRIGGEPAPEPEPFGDPGTKNYPAHQAESRAGDRDTAGEYTQPTTVAPPGKRRSNSELAEPAGAELAEPGGPARLPSAPSAAELAVGDRSGTLEVDPEVDGVELHSADDDLGELVEPPAGPGPRRASGSARRPGRDRSADRGGSARRSPAPSARSSGFKNVSTVELGDDELIEVEADDAQSAASPGEARPGGARRPGAGTAVRNAVKLPSGPIDLPSPVVARAPLPVPGPPAHLAQLIASQALSQNLATTAAPAVVQPQVHARSAIAAALPTAAALPLPVSPQQPPPSYAQALQQQLYNQSLQSPSGAAPQPYPPSPAFPASPSYPQPAQPGFAPFAQPLASPQAAPSYPAAAGFNQLQLPAHLQGNLAASRPTLALNALPAPPAPDGQGPAWARATMLAPTAVANGQATAGSGPSARRPAIESAGAPPVDRPVDRPIGPPSGEARLTPGHSRRARSRLALAVWVVIGAAVIGGGVFAGFQVRAMRLEHQIAAARERAVDVAKADTWQGWIGARDSLYGIAQASPTADNLAALARARAVLAFEFGDGAAEAKAAVDALAGRGGFDRELAAAYLALAQSDARPAREAADRALKAAPDSAAALYVSGQAALLVGDARAALADLRRAFEREPRPLYAVGLARALAASTGWDDAAAVLDRAGDHPSALIIRAALLAGTSRAGSAATGSAAAAGAAPATATGAAPATAAGAGSAIGSSAGPATAAGAGSAIGSSAGSATATSAGSATPAGAAPGAGSVAAPGQGGDLRGALARLVGEGQKPASDPSRTVSPAQVGLGYLALAQVDVARGDLAAARTDYRAALELGLDDQRFAEELIDTLVAIGELETARKAAGLAVERWPTSRRARTGLAQAWLGLGDPAAALAVFGKAPDTASWARGQTVRGQARVATGDVDGARADFDAALNKLPGYEPALIARASLDLASGELEDARHRLERKAQARLATPALIAAYAAVLRATGDPAARDTAKALLERAIGSGSSPDTVRAKLELARLDRDLGDLRAARAVYGDAGRAGSFEARLESALLQIDTGDPRGARDALDQLLGETGDRASAALLVEAARARTLTGAHAGADELLARAGRAPGAVAWRVDRERARLMIRRSDYPGAAQALLHALDGCGADLDAFLLAADTISADPKQSSLATKLKALVPVRLKGRPEIDIIAGKLDLAASPRPRHEDAEKHYHAARDALVAQKATPRRLAQADYGLAAMAYDKTDDPTAVSLLELVVFEDPSIYEAYLFAAEIARTKNPKKALELSQQATGFNPDSLEAWRIVGTLAAQLGNRKLLTEAINRVGELAPSSDTLHQLQKLR